MKKVFVSAVLLFSLSALAQAPSVAGKWKIHQSIAGNESDQECTIAVAEKTISGSCKGDDKATPIKGTVDGSNITWILQTEANGTDVTLTYKATVDKADKFSGTVDVQPYGVTGDFTATPVK